MKTKLLILTIFFLGSTLFIKAQEKYEFMIIYYSSQLSQISISIEGKDLIREEVKLPKETRGLDNGLPFLKKVNEYQDQGWEVMSFNNSNPFIGTYASNIYICYLRKK